MLAVESCPSFFTKLSNSLLKMYNFSNQTLFGIKNDSERHIWAGWLTFVVVSALLGDSLILIASIKYKAFKLHKLIVSLIQHIAVNDLISTVGSVAPAMLSTIYNSGSPYRFIDYLRFFITYYSSTTSSVFISSLALGKLLLLKHPLKLRFLSKKHAHSFCAGIWVVCISVPGLYLGIDKDDVIFDYRAYICSYRYNASLWKILRPVIALVVIIIPGAVVLVSTVLILREARKAVRRTSESLRWQGITTVVLTATVYVAAFLPYTVYCISEPFVAKDPDTPGVFHVEFFRFAAGILEVHILSNFFIYSLTVTSFRVFLVSKFYEIFAVCLKKSSSQGNII